MGSVTGLTAETTVELISEWESVAQKQAATDSEILSLRQEVAEARAIISEFTNSLAPELRAQVEANSLVVGVLNETTVANLDAAVTQQSAALQDVATVDIPALRQDLDNTTDRILEIPTEFDTDDQPLDDDPDRPLVIGDRWYPPGEPGVEYRWNGTLWVVAGLEVEDLTLAVLKYRSYSHVLY